MEIRNVAVIGAGDMGHGIAELFAMNGYEVALMDKFPEALEKANGKIAQSLGRFVERGKLTKAQSDAVYSRITFEGDMAKAVSRADLVVEAVPEIPELKKSVLKDAGRAAPSGAILASNTSNIRISELAEGTPGPERVVGMHFFNPPVVMKLVEVVPGTKTDPAVLDAVASVCARLGRTPIKVLKDSPGFIVDRINAAETLFFCLVLDRGIATPEEVDSYAKSQGLPMGPYELLDFVGVDIAWASLSYFSKTLSIEYGKGLTFARMVEANQLGKKTGKGFYDWSTGKASIPKAPPTDKVSVMDIFSIEINEAVKLIEEGVARPEDIEKGVSLGMGRPFGPISVAKGLSNSEVRSKLEELAKKFECKVFAPARSILDGRMLEVIESKPTAEVEPVGPSGAKPEKERGVAGPIFVEKLGGRVARVVINRPKQNTLNAEVLDGLDRILTELWSDNEVAVVLLTGTGDVFSAGADLSQFFNSSLAFVEFSRKGERIFKRIAEFPKLTVAVIKGYALGGGLELAMSCDLRLATEDAKLGLPEVTLGLVPGWSGTQKMARLIGLSRASALVLTGERISGKQAYEFGLVNKLVPAGDPDEYALQYGRELASALAPVAVMLAKRLLDKGTEVPSDVGLEMEALSYGVLFGTEDLKEGVSAFLGKRKPEYKGK
ncbi:MAG: 3-hydroxyacyl-CoA dehydrogenase NAD-binding domain-containing protein [Nitrososphaerales archaeon]